MKAILISIKPQYMIHILNGDKNVEARKNKALANAAKKMIAEQGYAQFLAYCSKNKKKLFCNKNGFFITDDLNAIFSNGKMQNALNGKIVCSFKCYKVEEIFNCQIGGFAFGTESMCEDELLCNLCLSYDELEEYLSDDDTYGYAIHISDLKIFDKPKELSEFKHIVVKQNYFYGCKTYKEYFAKPLTKAPQNFCYVEAEEE